MRTSLNSKVRQAQFALEATAGIRGTYDCPYSLVPEDDLVTQAGKWHQPYTEAAQRRNSVLIKQWIRTESVKAVEGGFGFEDFLALLRGFRRSAIDVEQWDEDSLSALDRVTNETILSLRKSIV